MSLEREKLQVEIPVQGRSVQAILAENGGGKKPDILEGRQTWSLQYFIDEEHHEVLRQAHQLYFSENYINPFLFKSLLKMEKAVVGMVANMMHGPDGTVGTMTSGGTESILLAMYSYREWAKKHRPNIKAPEIIAPPYHPRHLTKQQIILAFRFAKQRSRSMSDRCFGYGAVGVGEKYHRPLRPRPPPFAHGVLDPIPAIGRIGRKTWPSLPCGRFVGGFMLPSG